MILESPLSSGDGLYTLHYRFISFSLSPRSRKFHGETLSLDISPLILFFLRKMSETAKRVRSNFNGVHHPVVDFWRREVGGISSRNFSNRFSASENLVLRLEIYKKLEKHKGCVNTVSFNAQGDVLISGSDDWRVVLWDWQLGNVKLSFHSGHANNVFQAKFMPFSDDRTIVTCAADGMVRRANILEGGKVKTSLLGLHQGRAHKLCIEPGNPHVFYTCGEDGLVQRFDLRTEAPTELFTCHSVDPKRRNMEAIHLNAIAIDPRNSNLLVVGGMNEYARLYDIRRIQGGGLNGLTRAADHFCPPHLIGNEDVGITGLAFSEQSELLVSYNDEFIYLFTPDMGLGSNPIPASSKSSVSKSESASSPKDENKHSVPMVYKGHKNSETVKGVTFFGPRSEYVVSGSDCGRIFTWRKKTGELIRVMEGDRDVVNCIEPHPHIPVLASSGIETDIKVWTSKAAERAILPENIELRKRTPRGWMYRVSTRQELLSQLFAMQGRRSSSSPEREGEPSRGRALLNLIRTFNVESSDENATDDDDDDGNSFEDFFS
ncbi:PREDICTED: DDB1- and CUL4-associated factor 8-like isoform X2 [Camelina sativa]|uniref:DDB1- and CUL4-associated factor 8-like isoform X2 n=1 Tax=Camelina sativa TaxID=90675 RepID=A0ABM0UVJ9_CAMSA|nr:PREDICTED: DDB1- and CUL4-associated factor 8-like isoform X2 [Camelina sativa]